MQPELIGDRARLDLMSFHGKLGIKGAGPLDFEVDGGNRSFLELKNPDSVQAGIVTMMTRLEERPLPVPTAQLRFRVGAKGQLGLWVDSANLLLKELLAEQNWLLWCQDQGWHLELGQRLKSPVWNSDEKRFQLVPSTPQNWLSSFGDQGEEFEVASKIGLFSQPGPEANRALIAAGIDLLDSVSLGREVQWLEWGAGCGNLSLAFASRLGPRGISTELEGPAAELLEHNLKRYFPERVALKKGALSRLERDWKSELWLLDPPRSGFHQLIRQLHSVWGAPKPKWVLLYSCHDKGLRADSAELAAAGYKAHAYSLVDAFPATPYVEAISLWKRTIH
jgi:tRNA/tmRNA/rRNA uracil-C5-methylase (TrmA/RlmC/RlmD family)